MLHSLKNKHGILSITVFFSFSSLLQRLELPQYIAPLQDVAAEEKSEASDKREVKKKAKAERGKISYDDLAALQVFFL